MTTKDSRNAVSDGYISQLIVLISEKMQEGTQALLHNVFLMTALNDEFNHRLKKAVEAAAGN